MADVSTHSFPGSHALQLITLLERWNIPSSKLLKGTGLTESELESPNSRISCETMCLLSERTRTLTGEPGIGFYLGMQKRLTMYGFMGFAVIGAATVKEGLDLIIRYAPTVTTTLGLELVDDGTTATLTIEEYVDLGSAHDIALFSLLVGMRQLAAAMIGKKTGRVIIDIPIPKPDYFDRFSHLLPNARFDQSKIRLHFDSRILKLPLKTPDRAAVRLAQKACEQQLAKLGFDDNLATRVRQLAVTADGLRTVNEVARELGYSARTLKRRLARQNASFSQLVEKERKERAFALLDLPDLTLEDIAQQLHYSSVPNFARAFRRWTGRTPAQYRRLATARS